MLLLSLRIVVFVVLVGSSEFLPLISCFTFDFMLSCVQCLVLPTH